MSLILEALKKSEANRRLGEAPDLATPFGTPRRQRNVLPVLIVLIIAASIGGWWLLRSPSAPAAAPNVVAGNSAATQKPAADSNVANPAPAAKTPMPEHNIAASKPWLAAVRAAAPPPIAAPPLPSAPVASAPAPPAPAPRPVPAPTVANAAPTAAANAPMPAVKTTNRAPPPAEPKPDPVTSNVAVASGAGPKKTDAGALPPLPASVPTFGELPFATRKDLPALKVSMHVYSPDPAARFVLLNSSHLVEGDKLDDLLVQEIRPDGVIFEFKGQRFFLPRDGL